MPGELGIEERPSAEKPKLKEDTSDKPQLVFSPTIKYLNAVPSLCPVISYRDKVTKVNYRAKMAFQVRINLSALFK